MIRPIDIRLNAAHPELPLAEAVTFTGSPSTVLVRGVPPNCGRWAITAVSVAATFPDGSTTTRAAVQSANGVWVATLPATARSGRTANGLRVLADGIDETGEAVTGYILGVADFAVASLDVTPAPEPGETSWQMLYFDAVPSTLRKGDVAKVDGVLKLYNGEAWEAFAGDIPAPSTSTPAMDNGAGSAGSSAAFARGDHVHPTDTSRMAASATGEDIPAYDGSSQSVWNAISSVGSDAAQAVSKADAAVNTANGVAGAFTQHADNTTIHVTAAEKSTWNGKQSALSVQQLANIAAVPNKADASALLAKLDSTSAAPAFSSDSSVSYPVGSHVTYNGKLYRCTTATTGGTWVAGSWAADTVSNYFQYALTTKTISNNAVTLDDHATNIVTLDASVTSVTFTFPAHTNGKMRDFFVRLVIQGTTVPTLYFNEPNGGGAVAFDADDDAWADIEPGVNILMFSDTAE